MLAPLDANGLAEGLESLKPPPPCWGLIGAAVHAAGDGLPDLLPDTAPEVAPLPDDERRLRAPAAPPPTGPIGPPPPEGVDKLMPVGEKNIYTVPYSIETLRAV